MTMILRAAALCALVFGTPAAAQPAAMPTTEAAASRVRALIDAAGFSGEVAIAKRAAGPTLRHRTRGSAKQAGGEPLLWRWASVTKQVIAVLVMQEVAAGRLALDEPVARYLPAFRGANSRRITIRQLLQHRSGLPNPSAGATEAEFPIFYRSDFTGSRDPLSGFCAGEPLGEPGGQWSYNNCDYILLGAVLEAVTGKGWAALVQERIAKPLGLRTLGTFPTARAVRAGTIEGKHEPAFDLATYGASAGLYGSADDLVAFDHALMGGRLLPAAQLATLWQGDPSLGYMALGQWVFPATLAGCAKPVRIVERRGAIGGVQIRNFIAPDLGIAVVAFSDEGKFDFGEIWQGKGFSHSLLSTALCPAAAPTGT